MKPIKVNRRITIGTLKEIKMEASKRYSPYKKA